MKKSGVPLLLGIFILTLISIQGTPVMRSGRCFCINTSSGTMNINSLKSLDKYSPTPFCDKTEIIAVMKDGTQACLNPASAKVKNLIKEWEKKNSQKKRQTKAKKPLTIRKPQKHKKSQQRHQTTT